MDVWAADVYGTEERKPESLPAVLADKAAVEAPKAVLFGNEARGLEPTSSRAAAASSPSRFMARPNR